MRNLRLALAAAALLALAPGCDRGEGPWRDEFNLSDRPLSTTGRNRYFVLEPGFRIVLQSDDTRIQITVLDQTRVVDGVETRVVEERAWKNGALHEVARNYFAICERTKDVFYFGEDVDFYEGGRVTGHSGSWLAGRNGARAGLMMSGAPEVGMRYYQEIAPGVAMDRAEVVELDGVCTTPAGTFRDCLRTKEGTALDTREAEYKIYAPGIGLIGDADARLTEYGPIAR